MTSQQEKISGTAPRVCDAYCTLGFDRDEALDSGELLSAMDENGVDLALIAPCSHELAVANREGNQRIAKIAGAAPNRFLPGFSVNPWHRKEALKIAMEARANGGRVLILAPHRQGYHLGDSVVDHLVEWAVGHDLPIYAHAAPSSSGTPSQLFLLADRFRGGRFLLGRGGTTDYAYDMLPLLGLRLPNLWFDSGFVRPSGLRLYAEAAPDRFCFASCSPQNDLRLELELLEDALPESLRPAVLGENFLWFLNGYD